MFDRFPEAVEALIKKSSHKTHELSREKLKPKEDSYLLTIP
jgi:hypothetical protein